MLTERRENEKNGSRSTRITGLISVVVMLALAGAVLLPGAASAATKNCGSVVKKIYNNDGFYKAKVLVTSGRVPCSEARRIIWRALKPGGFWGGINGWHCDPKGSFDPFVEKCFKASPRRVIKSSKPKRCRSCRRNVKMLPLMRAASQSEPQGKTRR